MCLCAVGSVEILFKSLPAEALFAMVCNDPHALAVITSCWNRTLKVSKRPTSAPETVRVVVGHDLGRCRSAFTQQCGVLAMQRRLFRDMLLRLWPVVVCRPVPVPGAVTHPLSFLDNTQLARMQECISRSVDFVWIPWHRKPGLCRVLPSSRDARLLLSGRTVDENVCVLPVDTAATTLPLI
jgi:hypothetical protein